MADTHWGDVADQSGPAGTDTILVRRPGTQNSGRGVAYEVLLSDLQALIAGAARFAMLGTAVNVGFAPQEGWKTAGSAAPPATATWLRFVMHPSLIGAVPDIYLPTWRALAPGTPGGTAEPGAAERYILRHYIVAGAQVGLYCGRTSGDIPLVSLYYFRGPTLAASPIAIFYA